MFRFPARRFAARASVVAGIAFGAAAVLPGCFGHECEGDQVDYGLSMNEGDFIDMDTWESGPVDGKWLKTPPERTWVVHVPSWASQGREPNEFMAYVSADEKPNASGSSSNWTLGSGNLVIFEQASPGTVRVRNDTCASWYFRVVLRAAAAGTDAGATRPASLDRPSWGG
jgi:hypothetical protein